MAARFTLKNGLRMPIIDISVPVSTGMMKWPGHPELKIEKYRDMQCGDSSNSTMIQMSVHTGTHVDAPAHFIRDGKTAEALNLDALVGPCYVADCADVALVITANDLGQAQIPSDCQRLLIKTRNSRAWNSGKSIFDEAFVALDRTAAEWLVRRGMVCVGIDGLSIQKYKDHASGVHTVLLAAGMVIIEGLNLSAVRAGKYKLSCLPINLQGADGAPARAVLEECE